MHFQPIVIAFLIASQIQLFGQLDSKVTTAVVLIDQGQYEEGIDALNTALKDISQLEQKNIPKAYFYRAKARIARYSFVLQSDDAEATESIKNYPLLAAIDLEKAKAHDDGKWTARINTLSFSINQALIQRALAELNRGHGASSIPEQKQAYQSAIELLNEAEKLSPDNYLVYDLRGQARLGLADSASAQKDFEAAIKLHKENPPDRPDLFIGYAYYRLALIYQQHQKNTAKAIESLNNGLSMVRKEHQRILESQEAYASSELADLESRYNGVRSDLIDLKLDILLNSPEYYAEALAAFEEALKEDPADYMQLVAYASLLESTDPDKALENYIKATEADPKQVTAWFNAGALLLNKGVEMYKKGNQTDSKTEEAGFIEKGNEYFEAAAPYFEEVLKISPCESGALTALNQIYTHFELYTNRDRIMAQEAGCD